MRAVVWRGPAEMTVDDVPEPEPSAGTVVVEVTATGICGSDLTAYLGRMGVSRPGQIRGHEFAGVVVAAVEDDADWLDRAVAVDPLVSCGRCARCRQGATNLCPDQASIGIVRPGGFAERVAVPVRNLVGLRPGTDLVAAASAEPLSQAVHDVRLALRDGAVERALVIGAGSIGGLVVQAAGLLGIGDVSVLDPDVSRHAAAASAGARRTFSSREEVAGFDRDGGFDAVFDVVGLTRTRQDALDWTARGGTVLFVGLHEDSSALAWRDAIRREVTVRCPNASSHDDFVLATQWIEDGRAGNGGTAAVRLVALEDTPRVFRELTSGSATAGKVLVSPGS